MSFAVSASASAIAVPPFGLIAVTASTTVARSPVGPVIGPSVRENGTTSTRSCGRRCVVSRAAASRRKSTRRAMLWLLSTSSV